MVACLCARSKGKAKAVDTNPDGNGFAEKIPWVELSHRRRGHVPVPGECDGVDGEDGAWKQQPKGEGRDEDSLAVDLLAGRVLSPEQPLHLSLGSAGCAPHHACRE